jgi:hypothetical protein
MKLLFGIVTVLLLTSCTNPTITVQDVRIEQEENPDKAPPPPPLPLNPSVLQGAWTDGSTDNATFSFNNNGIYYVEHVQTYPYTIESDSITIEYEDHIYKAQILLHKDTLIMRNEDGETRFWRFRK